MASDAQDQSQQPQDYRQYQKNLQLNVEDWKKIFYEGGIDALLAKRKEIDEAWRKSKVLIAVIGQTGSGKSTLIKRLLDLSPDDESGPVIGGINKCCTLTSEEHSKKDTGLIYVDLPGVGAAEEAFAFNTADEQDRYCKKFDLQSVDYFILVSEGKVNDQEKFLIVYITQKLKKQFCFVQTKMDALRRERGTKSLEKQIGFPAIKKNMRDHIKNTFSLSDDKRIFLISNFFIDDEHDGNQFCTYDNAPEYDFESFTQQIQNDMQDENGLFTQKGQAFILATGAISKGAIRAVAKALREQSHEAAEISATIGISPIPGTSLICDVGIIVYHSKRYCTAFGVSPTSVLGEGTTTQKLANLFRTVVTNLGVRAAALLVILTALEAAEEGVKFIPFFGMLVGTGLGAGISYISTKTILGYVIDYCEIQALKLLERNS